MGGRIRYFCSGSAALSPEVGPVVRGRRAGDPRGVRAHRDQCGDHAEPAGSGRLRHRGPADAGHRGQDRRRRRDHGPRRRRHARLPRPARADRGGAARRRVVRDRRRRRARRPGAGAHHRPQEGPAQDQRREVHRAAAHRVGVQGDLPDREPDDGDRSQLRGGADHAGRRRRDAVGAHEGPGRRGRPGRAQSRPAGGRLRAAVRRRAQRPAQPVGVDQAVPDPRARPVRRRGRAHPVAEGEARRRREAVRRRHRVHVRRRRHRRDRAATDRAAGRARRGVRRRPRRLLGRRWCATATRSWSSTPGWWRRARRSWTRCRATGSAPSRSPTSCSATTTPTTRSTRRCSPARGSTTTGRSTRTTSGTTGRRKASASASRPGCWRRRATPRRTSRPRCRPPTGWSSAPTCGGPPTGRRRTRTRPTWTCCAPRASGCSRLAPALVVPGHGPAFAPGPSTPV